MLWSKYAVSYILILLLLLLLLLLLTANGFIPGGSVLQRKTGQYNRVQYNSLQYNTINYYRVNYESINVNYSAIISAKAK